MTQTQKYPYQIDGYNFRLNEDLTIDEQEEVSKFFDHSFAHPAPHGPVTAGNFTDLGVVHLGNFNSDQIKRFFEIILEPEYRLPENFSFGKIKESVQLNVIKDFFLSRIQKSLNMQSSLMN